MARTRSSGTTIWCLHQAMTRVWTSLFISADAITKLVQLRMKLCTSWECSTRCCEATETRISMLTKTQTTGLREVQPMSVLLNIHSGTFRQPTTLVHYPGLSRIAGCSLWILFRTTGSSIFVPFKCTQLFCHHGQRARCPSRMRDTRE